MSCLVTNIQMVLFMFMVRHQGKYLATSKCEPHQEQSFSTKLFRKERKKIQYFLSKSLSCISYMQVGMTIKLSCIKLQTQYLLLAITFVSSFLCSFDYLSKQCISICQNNVSNIVFHFCISSLIIFTTACFLYSSSRHLLL